MHGWRPFLVVVPTAFLAGVAGGLVLVARRLRTTQKDRDDWQEIARQHGRKVTQLQERAAEVRSWAP